MGMYAEYCLPFLIDKACGSPAIQHMRQKIVPLVKQTLLSTSIGKPR